jgi:hypothetical protein
VKTVYDLYYWSHPDARAEITYGFATMHDAAASITERPPGLPADFAADPTKWVRVPDGEGGEGWALADWVYAGTDWDRSPWNIFERQQAETGAERIELALEEIGSFGQTDGAHHKAHVIDQVVRILTGDGYDAWIREYRDGEDGPETYEWDEGIAP